MSTAESYIDAQEKLMTLNLYEIRNKVFKFWADFHEFCP